jgi:hypothetical protein
VARVQAGFISVTPLHLDLTARQHFRRFDDWPWNEEAWTD